MNIPKKLVSVRADSIETKNTNFIIGKNTDADIEYIKSVAAIMLGYSVSRTVIVRTAVMSYAEYLRREFGGKNIDDMTDEEKAKLQKSIQHEQDRLLRGAGKLNRRAE